MTVLTIILLTLVACAFFSGMEIAFLTANKLRIEMENKQGNLGAKLFSFFNRQPGRFLGTMLLGNNIALVIYGIYMEKQLEPELEKFIPSHIAVFLLQTFISTLIILVAAEFLPKNIFRINPNRVLNIFAAPVAIVYYILSIPVYLTSLISDFVLNKLFGIPPTGNKKAVFGRVDLDNYVKEMFSFRNSKMEMDHEIKIFRNALNFSNVKARECMIPRTEIIAVDASTPVEKLKEKFISTRLSKILIFNGSIDHITGYIHSYELFKKPESIRSILLPVTIVPESIPAREVLTVLLQQRKSIAVVVDEFGGTSGILTMEDVIEEIFGEIDDEHDKEELVEKQLSENEYLFSGRMEIDYLNEKYAFRMPVSEEYTTLSGLVIYHYESIPRLNDRVPIGRFTFIISEVKETRIEKIIVKIHSGQD